MIDLLARMAKDDQQVAFDLSYLAKTSCYLLGLQVRNWLVFLRFQLDLEESSKTTQSLAAKISV